MATIGEGVVTDTARLMCEAPRRRDDAAPTDYCSKPRTAGLIRQATLADAMGEVRSCCAHWLRSAEVGAEWRTSLIDLKANWDAQQSTVAPSARRYTDSRRVGGLLVARISEAKRLAVAGQFQAQGRTQKRLNVVEERLDRIEAALTELLAQPTQPSGEGDE